MRPVSRHDELVDRDAQRQGQAPLLPLGGVGPGLPPFEGQQEVVPVGPHGVDPPPEVVVAVRGQRVEEFAGPAPDVVLPGHHVIGCPGQSTVGGPDEAGPGLRPGVLGPRPGSSRPVPAVRPRRRVCWPRRALTRPPAWRNNAARCRSIRSTSSAARAPSASRRLSASSRRSRRIFGPPLTMARSSGEKIVQGAALARSFRPWAALRLTCVRLRPSRTISASTKVGLPSPLQFGADDRPSYPRCAPSLLAGRPERIVCVPR